MSARRRLIAGLAGALLATAAPGASAQDADPGAGAQVGGVVLSTLALGLEQQGDTVRATVTTTDAPSSLSVAADGGGGLSAAVGSTPATLDPGFGLELVAWDDVLAGRTTTIRLRSTRKAAAVVFVTLGAQAP